MRQNMIELTQLRALLQLNEVETVKAMRDRSPDGTKRLYETMLHRVLIKDLIIEELEYYIETLVKESK